MKITKQLMANICYTFAIISFINLMVLIYINHSMSFFFGALAFGFMSVFAKVIEIEIKDDV